MQPGACHSLARPPALPPSVLRAACKFTDYTSDIFGFTYLFNNCPDGFATAQTNCTQQGGHLVSYESVDEQAEVRGGGGRRLMGALSAMQCALPWGSPARPVPHTRLLPDLAPDAPNPHPQVEDYFSNVLGVLVGSYHEVYWIGLYIRPGTARPNWVWTDPMAVPPNVADDVVYKNWGLYRVGLWAGSLGLLPGAVLLCLPLDLPPCKVASRPCCAGGLHSHALRPGLLAALTGSSSCCQARGPAAPGASSEHSPPPA
jgi:hypothetical protein